MLQTDRSGRLLVSEGLAVGWDGETAARRRYRITVAGIERLKANQPPRGVRCCRCKVKLGGPVRAIRRKTGRWQCRDGALCLWRRVREFGKRQLAWDFL